MGEGIDVVVCEVGLRDGLQLVPGFFATSEKLAWIEAEAAAGMPEIEVTSFVSPKLVPQFIDAEEVARGFVRTAAKYANERIVFDRPIGQSQCIQFPIARVQQIAPISTNLILAYIGEHVLGMPRSY